MAKTVKKYDGLQDAIPHLYSLISAPGMRKRSSLRTSRVCKELLPQDRYERDKEPRLKVSDCLIAGDGARLLTTHRCVDVVFLDAAVKAWTAHFKELGCL